MLSKEEIEKVKERLVKQAVTSSVGCEDYPNCICMKKDLKTLLQYIDQLETDNLKLIHMLDDYIAERKKQNKMIDEMAEYLAIIRDCPMCGRKLGENNE